MILVLGVFDGVKEERIHWTESKRWRCQTLSIIRKPQFDWGGGTNIKDSSGLEIIGSEGWASGHHWLGGLCLWRSLSGSAGPLEIIGWASTVAHYPFLPHSTQHWNPIGLICLQAHFLWGWQEVHHNYVLLNETLNTNSKARIGLVMQDSILNNMAR